MKIKRVNLWECDDWKSLTKRSERTIDSVTNAVSRIISDVRKNGDRALIELTKRLDGADLEKTGLMVNQVEMKTAGERIDAGIKRAIRRAARNIENFHRINVPKPFLYRTMRGIRAGIIVRPLRRVGLYVPGGLARYPSTVLMGAIPARVAGVKDIIICTPPQRDGSVDPVTLFAATEAGVKKIFRVGGAQAIAAMAYGTETVPKVDKIVGPGNIYVNAAKYLVSKDVEIDFIAGPSEILIIADDSADPLFIAADMIAQAEHDPEAAAVLVTTSRDLAGRVNECLKQLIDGCGRRDTVLRSLNKHGLLAVARNLGQAIDFANEYAPEHLEIITENPEKVLPMIENAGSIFIGPYSPVAAGDFITGPNHILPTGGKARCRSGLSALDFTRLPTVQMLSKAALLELMKDIEALAAAEGLPAHVKSVGVRVGEKYGN